MNQNENTMLAVLPPAERAAAALKSADAEIELRDMIARTKAITNVVDKNGREEAHGAGMMLKRARTAIASVGKAAREDATAFSKAVIAEEKRLIDIVAPEEERLIGLRDAFDAKLAAEKAEKERIEAERKAAIRDRIDAILRLPTEFAAASPPHLSGQLAILARRDLGAEGFDEFIDEARAALDKTATALLALRDAALAREEAARQEQLRQEEAARKAEETARELDRLNAELAERNRIEAEDKAKREAAEARARAEADERDRQLAEQKAAMERHQEQMNEVLAIQNLAGTTGDWATVDAALQRAVDFQPEDYGSMAPMAKLARNTAIDALNARLATLEKPAPAQGPQSAPLSFSVDLTDEAEPDEAGTRSIFRDLDDPVEPAPAVAPASDEHPLFGANRRETAEEAAALEELVATIPLAVFQTLNRHLNRRGFLIAVNTTDEE